MTDSNHNNLEKDPMGSMESEGQPRPSEAPDENTILGMKIQRKRTLRVALTLISLLVGIVTMTNIYVAMVLQMSIQHIVIFLLCLGVGTVFLGPLLVVKGVSYARKGIEFGRIISAGGTPSKSECLEAVESYVNFPIKLSLLLTGCYLVATLTIAFVLHYIFHFSGFELISIATMGIVAGLNLGIIMYYSVKRIERPQLEKAVAYLFEAGHHEFKHHRVSLRLKMLLVFFMVVAYIISMAVFMGYSQVYQVQRAHIQDNLEYRILGNSISSARPAWDGGDFILTKDGEFLSGKDSDLTEAEHAKIMASPQGGTIVDEGAQKLVVFSSGEGGMISGAIGYWGKSKDASQQTWKLLMMLIVATVLLCVISVVLVVSDIEIPITQTLEYLRQIWRGENVQTLKAYSDDEMGALVGEVMKTTQALRDRTGKTEAMLGAVREIISGLHLTISNVRNAGEQQSSAVREQVAAVEQALSASSQILATSKQISENATDVEMAAENNSNACEEGKGTISESLDGFSRLGQYVQYSSAAVMEVGDQYEKVRGIISIIQEIAAQVDLLALNAQIEAAGAGEEGKRFAVVAQEVGRLANGAAKAVSEIKNLINNLHSELQKIIGEASKGSELVKTGAVLADNVGGSIEGIKSLAEKTSQLARGITLITRQQTSASEQMAETMRSIHDSAQLILENADVVQHSMHNLEELGEKLDFILREG